jgi:hypothetical protein
MHADLTSDMARDQARNGWLTDAQYLAILANPDEYQGLRLQGQIGLYLDNVLNGPDGTSRSCRFSWRCMSFFKKKKKLIHKHML